jgi:hypothetical protein
MATKNVIRFDASMFVSTSYQTAENKAWFANHLLEFIRADFVRAQFTKKFYQRLSNTFGHIAHFNLQGFWETFFESTVGKVEFLRQTLEYPCYGYPEYTFSDVEKAVQQVLQEQNVLTIYEARLRDETERAEKALLRQLQGKYEGIPASVPVLAAPQPAIKLNSPKAKFVSEHIPSLFAFQSEAVELTSEAERVNQLLLF